MVYIPEEWLLDKSNMESVHRLFSEYFPGDILTAGQVEKQKEFPERLRKIGEEEILRRFENREIVMD